MVVTIVVLLILAGVSINLLVDKNGIIQRSKEAKNKYGQAKDNEQANLNKISDWIDSQVKGNDETTKPIKVGVNEKATSNGTISGEEGNLNNPTIPEGYTPINTDTSNWGDGSNAPTQDSVDHGLVIRDEEGNEWVWVPVPDVTVMCDTSNTTEYTLCGTEGDTAVTTNKYSKSDIISGLTRTTPGTSTYGSRREPDLVIGSDNENFDTHETHYKTILGFASKEKMAEAFVADYNEMIASIGQYGGFYIGRYELSSVGVQKDKATLTNTDWYNLYKKCKELNASNKVETRMIWGCQWDVTCNFIANKGDKKSITDSSSWENYKNTSVKADDGTTELKASETSSRLNTGKTTFTMANNIYDLAGNCQEWTQEAINTSLRADRGGSYYDIGSSDPASSRVSHYPGLSGYENYGRYPSYFNNKVILDSRA